MHLHEPTKTKDLTKKQPLQPPLQYQLVAHSTAVDNQQLQLAAAAEKLSGT